MNHENIVNRCKQGDAKAQKVLYDFFAPEMLGIAYRYVAGYDLANEVLQLSIIKKVKAFYDPLQAANILL